MQPNFEERLLRSRQRQAEVAARSLRKKPSAQHDQRSYWSDPGFARCMPSPAPRCSVVCSHTVEASSGQTLSDLREYGEALGLHRIDLKACCVVTGVVQACTLGVLATSSWLLPWIIPSASISFVLAVGLVFSAPSLCSHQRACPFCTSFVHRAHFQVSSYVADKSESAIILFIASCFILFGIAACDTVALQYCLHLPECRTLYINATPIIIMVFEPLLAVAGMYLAVFKTAYEPLNPRDDDQWVSRGRCRVSMCRCVHTLKSLSRTHTEQ